MIEPKDESTTAFEDDPRYVNAKREALFILFMWLGCFFYTIIYCYLHGYQSHEPGTKATGPPIGAIVGELKSFNRQPTPPTEEITTPFGLGIPDWVFWGIILPWGVCIILSVIFCFFIFTEDPLEDDTIETATGEK